MSESGDYDGCCDPATPATGRKVSCVRHTVNSAAAVSDQHKEGGGYVWEGCGNVENTEQLENSCLGEKIQ